VYDRIEYGIGCIANKCPLGGGAFNREGSTKSISGLSPILPYYLFPLKESEKLHFLGDDE
jgi:hypothetical protein